MKFKKVLRLLSAAFAIALLGVLIPAAPAVAAVLPAGLNPSSGPVGTYVSVSGSGGWTGTVSINAFGNIITTPASSGNFSAVLTVPTLPRGSYPVIISDTSSNTANLTFVLTPQLILGTGSGFVGDQLSISGNGFQSYATVSIYWDAGATAITTASCGVNGSFAPVSVAVPAAAHGIHVLTGADGAGATPPVNFTVNSKITINPTSGGVGDGVSVTGTGFDVSSGVTITLDDVTQTTTPSSITTNTNGGFTASFTMPMVARGSHTVKATDASTNYAIATFTVGQKISLSPVSGFVGDTVTINGSGFSAGKAVTVTLDSVAVTTTPSSIVTNTSGGFTATFVIPATTGGAHTINAVDSDTNAASGTLTVNAKLTMTPATGLVGTQVTLSGSGFAANSNVSITFDTTIVATITTNATGGFSGVTFNVPASTKGAHTVKAQDAAANQATASFATTEKVVLNPTSGAWGDTVTITGTGFAGTKTVTLTMDTYSLSSGVTITTDAVGSFTATFQVLALSNGTHVVKASDSSGNSATAELSIKQKISLSPTTGAAATQVTVTGTGFAASKSITIKYNNAVIALSSAVNSDANGSFVAAFAVPATVAGSFDVEASDGTNSAKASFAAVSKADIKPTKPDDKPENGYVGMEITITGTGFKANSGITVTYETTPVIVSTVTSDANGSFTATFKVPASAAGTHTIKASDGTTTKEFAFVMESTPPAAPLLSLPPDKYKPKQPVPFSWNAVIDDPSGVTYDLQISLDPNFGTLVLEKKGLSSPNYTMTKEEKLKSAGGKTPYNWRVRAVDGAGNVGAWSTANAFSIGFMWPSWMIHVWYSLGIIVALILGLWLGRRMAYKSY